MEQNHFLRWMGGGALILIVWIFAPFLKSFFVALLLAMAFSPLHRSLELKIISHERFKPIASLLSASTVTLGLSLIIFLPIVIFLFQLLDSPSNTIAMIRSVGEKIDILPTYLPAYMAWLKDPLEHLIVQAKLHQEAIIAFFAQWFGSGLKTFMSMLGEMAMIVIFFFFLNWYGRSITLFTLPIIPLARSIKREFLGDMMTTTAVVFYTLAGVMMAQGVAFGIFIAFFEGYNPFLLGFMAGISAIIPVVGTALIWVPVAVNEYLRGNIMHALVISLYSWAVMAFFIDNIVKLLILNYINRKLNSGEGRINEFVIFFAIVGGLATFGFWGLILGPAIVAFTITTLRVLRKTNRGGLR
ncbi:MAG: AI-2E family transporter [Sulfuricurvum sp.]|uniref:AI-2E family transporter n=1 Tax=Sulfuricurvum sp. TaxID=2025608 RepID=UPI0026006B7D|nr:AI-2E family transporter [Sulfuricurvum sp.]MCK9374359.1 AI-2E family transporter [Sulfuricurvum sp.]